jgi:hypothetical protein
MTFRVNSRIFRSELKKVKRYVNSRNRFPEEVFDEFVENTPRDKGNARDNTKLKKAVQGWKIVGDYPYSGVIDKGRYPNPPAKGTGKTVNGYSTQARQGIIKPTLKFAKKEFKRFLRRIR